MDEADKVTQILQVLRCDIVDRFCRGMMRRKWEEDGKLLEREKGIYYK